MSELVRLIDKDGIEIAALVVRPPEPIFSRIVDLLDTKHGNVASIAANGTAGYKTKSISMEDDFAVEDGVFAQYRIELMDDILIEVAHPEAGEALGATKAFKTYLSKHLPRHDVFKRSAVANTEAVFWSITNNTEAGKRVAKIKKLVLSEEGGAVVVVRLGDGDGTGTDAAAASADLSFSLAANETLVLDEGEIPEKEFESGISYQLSAATATRVSATIEEDNTDVFKGKLHKQEIFVYQDDKYPYFTVINPIEDHAQTKARVVIGGYKYKIDTKFGVKGKGVPIPLGRVV